MCSLMQVLFLVMEIPFTPINCLQQNKLILNENFGMLITIYCHFSYRNMNLDSVLKFKDSKFRVCIHLFSIKQKTKLVDFTTSADPET